MRHLFDAAGRRQASFGGCGQCSEAVHDLVRRRIRVLSVFEALVELVVPRVRVLCLGGGSVKPGPRLYMRTAFELTFHLVGARSVGVNHRTMEQGKCATSPTTATSMCTAI